MATDGKKDAGEAQGREPKYDNIIKGLLDPDNDIQRIRYFTAPVSGKLDAGQPIGQQIYLQALSTISCVTIHQGNFLTNPKIRSLVHPQPGGSTHVEIYNTEEKGSDVNLATYLIHDAWRNLFDVAVVLSQDTDLVEPVRIVRDETKKDIGVFCLDGQAPGKLAKHGSFVRHITHSRLASAQFLETMPFGRKGKTVTRPTEWKLFMFARWPDGFGSLASRPGIQITMRSISSSEISSLLRS